MTESPESATMPASMGDAASLAVQGLAASAAGNAAEVMVRILQSITDGFYGFDADWRFTFVNEAGMRTLSSHMDSPASVIGRNYWEAFPHTRGTVIEREFLRAVRDQVPVEFENFYAPWQSWFAVRAYPIQGGGLSVYFRDVTEEKRVAAALKASEERYRSLFDSIDDGFCVIEMIWDENGKPVDYLFLEVNPTFERHTGMVNSQGRRMREIIPDHEDLWFQIYGEVAKTGEPVHFSMASAVLGRWFDLYAFRVDEPEKGHVAVKFNDVTERVASERQLQRLAAENRDRVAELETLLDVLPVGISIALDAECKDIRLNPAMSRMLEVPQTKNASKTAPLGERPDNFTVLDDEGNEVAGENLPMQIVAREGGEIRDYELNIQHADGRRMRLLEYVAPLFDAHGRTRGSVGAFLDITERAADERRQKFLLALEDNIRALGYPDDIVAASARLLGEHLQVDRCAYATVEADEDTMNILGDYTQGVPSIVGRYTFAEFGREVLELMREGRPFVVHDVQTHQPPLADLAAYKATLIRAVICVPLLKDGRLVAAMAVHMKTPRVWQLHEVSLVQHVASRCWESLERTRVTQDLLESEARFRQIADLMPQILWLARPDGYVDYFNKRWSEFTGMDRKTAGRDWSQVLHPEDREACVQRWMHSVATGEPYEIRYRWWHQPTETWRWMLGRALPLRNERGELTRWYGTSTDIDDVVRAEQEARDARAEAERANRAKDDFLAVLSHELRTPMTPVLMAAEDLSQDTTLPDSARRTLQMMQRNISLEARLIDDLLDLTRIIHGKLALRRQQHDAHALLQHALEIVQDDAQGKGLVLAVDLGAARPQLLCDPARLQQVFWNLLKNAVKFTPMHGTVSIRTRDGEGSFILEVKDTGIGIEPEFLDRIFLPFEQAGLANDHRCGGLGLGLSISKAIVEMHEGDLVAESEGPGGGALFRLSLPVVRQAAGETTADAGTDSEGNLEPKTGNGPRRLLLVEDHEATLSVLARLLRRAGYEVHTAATVHAARSVAAGTTFDLVVSDIGLPDGSGMDLMQSLSREYGLRGIALTGYGMEEDVKSARDSGFIAHLTKPVEFAQLRRILESSACRN